MKVTLVYSCRIVAVLGDDRAEGFAGLDGGPDLRGQARDGARLIGISRAVTDFSYCCYLSDLAVDAAYQRQGIGKRLIEETHRAAGETRKRMSWAASSVLPARPSGIPREPSSRRTGVKVAESVSSAIEAGRKPGMPLSVLSNIAREAPLGSLLVAFLLGVAVARRR